MTNRIPSYLEYIKNIAITSGGSGYTQAPAILISAPDGDNPIQATANSVVSGGVITSITIVESGDGYHTTPTVKVIGNPTAVQDTSSSDSTRDAGTYTGVAPDSTSGSGANATFDIVIDSNGDVTSITPNATGVFYAQGDTISFSGTSLGGQGTELDVTGTITHIFGGQNAVLTAEVDIVSKADVYSQPRISKLVSNQLPEFIRSDHELFVTFIEKYYEFMEQNNTTDITKHGPLKVLQDFLSKLDADFNDDGSINTDDNFLKEFYKDYAKDLPVGQSAKLSLVLKNINDFYTAKGSAESIKLLFRILYNEEVSIFNAQEFVLRPSSSKWQQDYVVKIYERGTYINATTTDYDPLNFVGQQIDLHYYQSTGSVTNSFTKRASCQSVKKIAYTNPQAYELVLTGIDNTFVLPGAGAASVSYDEILQPEISGDIGTITNTNTPDPSVVDGTYTIGASDYTAYIDTAYATNTAVTKGSYIKANNKIYLAINSGTTNTSGTGPDHESGEVVDGSVKFRFIEISTATGHYSSGSSGATFSVVISGNAVSSVTVTDDGVDYYPNEIIEIPATKFGGTGTGVLLKVNTITNGKIKKAIIIDGGSGFAANPDILITPNSSDTITTTALMETRVSNGAITQVLFTNNESGAGYNNLPELRISTGLTLSFVSLADEKFPDTIGTDVFSAIKGIVTRVLKTATFNSIKTGSSATAGGFKIGDSYVINETGGILGVYAIDYFAEDYTLTGVSNNAYVRITSLDANGYPSNFEVLAVGQGFNREDFQIEITSPSGNIAIVDFKSGYNAVLGGVAGDAGGFLSDANKLYDNLVYQPFAYQIQSELPAADWKEYVKRAAHPAGFALFGDLQIKQDIDFSAGYQVETDVYMFFVYPDIEEILVQETVVKDIVIAEAGPDSIFPGDAINSFDVGISSADSVGASDEDGPYTYTGTSIRSYYATSDGTETGDPYFVVHGTASDDYVERFAVGDYFLNDGGAYVELGNPQKEMHLIFNSADTGEYALDYFANNDGRYTLLIDADVERSTAYAFASDTLTKLEVEVSSVTDSVEMGESLLISFVFFRTPSDTFDTADSVVVEAQPRPTDTFDIADAVDKFDIGVNPTDVPAFADEITLKEISTTATDTFTGDDTLSIEPQLIGTDTTLMQDTPSVEWGGIKTDTFNIADAVDKFDIGVNPTDTPATGDAVNKFDVTTGPTDSSDTADSITKFDVEIDLTGSSVDEDVAVGDSGSLISQSYTVDLTYFAEDYVADTVVNF